MAEKLPEGTDHILPGSEGAKAAQPESPAKASTDAAKGVADLKEQAKAAADAAKSDAADVRDQAKAKAEEFRAHALDQVRDYAQDGQAKASGALDQVAKLIGDNATQIDEFAGTHYGDYARRASAYVSDAATSVRDKDIDELLDVARDFVRRAPGAALAAATVAGFFAARVVKAGTAEETVAPRSTSPAAPRRTPARRTGAGSRR